MTIVLNADERSDEGSSEYLRNSCREASPHEHSPQANVALLLS